MHDFVNSKFPDTVSRYFEIIIIPHIIKTVMPCDEGYYYLGDTCEKAPPGYVETRNECEIGVDSREAAGVVQDYTQELELCRTSGLDAADPARDVPAIDSIKMEDAAEITLQITADSTWIESLSITINEILQNIWAINLF